MRPLLRLLPLLIVPALMAAPATSSAQTVLSMQGGARAGALGGAATALEGDVWGHANPSSWATLDGRAVAFFATQGFGLSELRLGAARYVEPTSVGAFAAGARTFGFSDFRESVFTLGYARGFGLGTSRRFYAGAVAQYYRVSLGDNSEGASYGSAGAFGLSLGAMVRPLERLTVGAHAANLNAPSYGGGGEDLPQTLSLGLAYRPTDRLLVLADAFKDIDYPVSFRAGLEVTPVEALALRAGVTTKPTRFSAGAGLRVSRFRADLAAEHHETLGWTPAVALGVRW